MYLINSLHGKLVIQAGCKGVLVLRHSIVNKLLQNAFTLLPAASLPAQVDDNFKIDSGHQANKLHANSPHGPTKISIQQSSEHFV